MGFHMCVVCNISWLACGAKGKRKPRASVAGRTQDATGRGERLPSWRPVKSSSHPPAVILLYNFFGRCEHLESLPWPFPCLPLPWVLMEKVKHVGLAWSQSELGVKQRLSVLYFPVGFLGGGICTAGEAGEYKPLPALLQAMV